MPAKPATVAAYLAALPDDRRKTLKAVRRVIRANLDAGYAEGMQYGMPAWFVPHAVYPAGYHVDPKQPLPYASMASQKHHLALYLLCVYGADETQRWLRDAWARAGKKLDMGKSCIRFKRLDDLPLDVIGAVIRRTPVRKHVAAYEAAVGQVGRHGLAGARSGTKNPARRKKVTKRS